MVIFQEIAQIKKVVATEEVETKPVMDVVKLVIFPETAQMEVREEEEMMTESAITVVRPVISREIALKLNDYNLLYHHFSE